MPKTITLDSAQLREARVVITPSGEKAVQVSFSLLAGPTVVQTVNLLDVTAQLEPQEKAAAEALVSALLDLLIRVELS